MLTESHADAASTDGATRAPRPDARFAAYGMFGELRNSTPVERALCEDMLARMGTPVGVSVLDQDEGDK